MCELCFFNSVELKTFNQRPHTMPNKEHTIAKTDFDLQTSVHVSPQTSAWAA